MKKAAICSVLFIVLIISLAFNFNLHKRNQENPIVRIGIIPWPGYAHLRLAHDKGFYEQEGIQVEIIEQASTINQFTALEQGQVSVVGMTLNELLDNNLHWKTTLKIVSILDYSFGGDVILSQKGIQSIEDLNGKKIAAEDSTLALYMINRALDKAGMETNDIEIVNTGLEFGVKAMINKEVDAFVGFAPFSTEIENAIKVNRIFCSKEIPEEIIDVLAVEEQFLKDCPECIKKIIRGWKKAYDYSKLYPQESNKIMARHEGVSVSDFKKSLEDLHIPDLKEQKQIFARKSIEEALDRILNIVFTEEQKKNAPPINHFIDDRILNSLSDQYE